MLRPPSLIPALAAVVATMAVPLVLTAPATAGSSAAARNDAPLAVTIDSLAPSVIPDKGPVRVTGSVTNTDDATWYGINMHAYISSTPITSIEALDAASDIAPAAFTGNRITVPGTFDTITSLEPGESAQFQVRVPRGDLEVTAAGVYWFGIHAIGEGPIARDSTADGRARTFLPLVPNPPRRKVDTALVLPIRERIDHAADGSLDGLARWTRTLSPGGRLRHRVDFGVAAGNRPLTWLIDPAVADAARALTLGNPPRSLAEAGLPDSGPPESQPPASEPPASEPSASADPDSLPPTPSDVPDPLLPDASDAAASWLDRLREGLSASQVLTLPYGDLDVAGAADLNPPLYERARNRNGVQFAEWELRTSPGLASPSGFLSEAALELVGDTATVLLDDRAFTGPVPPAAQAGAARVVPTSSGSASGGPGPNDPLALIAVRQRIVSEAALRSLNDPLQPLVVVLPRKFAPSAATGFFEGLDLDWIRLTSVAAIADRKGRRIDPTTLRHPRAEARRQLDASNFGAASALVRSGESLQRLLSENKTIAGEVVAEALTDVSYSARQRPRATRASANRSRAWIDERLRSVTIDTPPGVTLSGVAGKFAATVTNGLDEPATVRIQAVTSDTIDISGPMTVELAAGAQTTVLLNANASELGVHNVTLVLTDAAGNPLGSSDTVPIRSARVTRVIWLILGAGIGLLFTASGVRLVRRVRTHGEHPADDPADPDDTDPAEEPTP